MEKEMGVGMGMGTDTKVNINEGRVQVDDGDGGSEFMDGAGNVCYSSGTSYSRIPLAPTHTPQQRWDGLEPIKHRSASSSVHCLG